ncbi:MAG: 23S rRNA (uracil(1939)-C(5))-methyltransferase RlmD [Clostridia bacterium]|nr:23S rRNA (uracil(1939)-C(5))-methyltransferase RlmD [Clostridia bacterium]
MMPNKNDIVTLEITDITLGGAGVGKTEEGYVLFVPGTAPGDIIKAKILKTLASYGYAKVEEILTPSPDRIEVDCPVFSKCGGCVFRHISYEKELEIKKKLVDTQFERIGGLDIRCEGITPSPQSRGYRNKAQFPVGSDENGLYFGFFAQHSHRIIKCENCALHPEFYEQILAAIKKWGDRYAISAYNEETKKGLLRHVYVRNGRQSGEIIVCLVATGNTPKTKELISALLATGLNIVGVVLCINKKEDNEILSDNFRVLWGKGYMTDTLCGVEFDISPRSFYQVNHDGAEALYGIAAEYARLTGSETVIDLYCGTDTIGLSMAKKAKKLIGIEIIPDAVKNAAANAARAGIENAEFICADAGKAALELAARGIKPEVIIVDPPRKGLSDDVIAAIADMAPERVVMISCNSATAARDAKKLDEAGYTAVKMRAVDMFARTGHVETVVGFVKK